ncbi:MAG: UDP-N-acetylmuramate dehydrogenase [Candidatus Latescibacteria bacterium]|nr:UDP-N-acetylmuramate dehydrogenase [Candidatus Latescibacterota bacterium]
MIDTNPTVSAEMAEELRQVIGPRSVLPQAALSTHTTFKVGGPADWLCLPETVSQLRDILSWINKVGTPWIVLGNGSNILFSDDGFRGVVIKIRGARPVDHTLWHLSHSGVQVRVGAGVGLARVASYCAEAGLTGMEWATGIPGVVGGAVRGNAGAHGWEMGDVINELEVLTSAGMLETLQRDSLSFRYRHSGLASDLLITGATLSLTEDDPSIIRRRIQEYTEQRKNTQPSADQSAGCMFKNPAGESAGRLIDIAGCKGVAVGGAMVSPLHGNFIVNRGGATSKDTLSLIDSIREKVRMETGVELELEVRVVGSI